MSILIFRRRHHTVPPFLVFSTQPGGANSGSAFSPQPVVTAKNPDGTTKTGFTGNVTVALNAITGSPTLTGTATVAAVAGVATFSGLGTTGGASTWTLTATSPGYSSATSSTGTTTAGGFAAITDSFNRADNASSLGTTDTGQTWTNMGGAVAGISGNQAYLPTTVAAGIGAVVDRGTANMTVQATMVKWTTSAGNTGLVFRCIDANNYWWTEKVGGALYVNKVVAGTNTQVTFYTPGAMADGDVHSVSVDASNLITVKLNGTTLGSFTDAANSSGTKAGIGGIAVAADRWDNFSVTSP